MCGGGAPAPAPAPPPMPVVNTAAVNAAKLKATQETQASTGRASTVLSGQASTDKLGG